jgi:hypothetical protein
MEKEGETRIMHEKRFGERERLAHNTCQPLWQRVLPALHMSGFSWFLAHGWVLLFWNDSLLDHPKIGEAVSCTIGWWNGLP